ncbi:MAG: hypothetical protein GX913_07120 [Clostridiales bacterium]|mgnify:CR=1 FL=1|nr:hypothetical protein [Clostridiales bacterium]
MDKIGKTRAFLTEFIIVILFFSLAVVVTLQLFLAAHNQSELSKDTTIAYIKAQNIAEEIKVHSDNLGEFLTAGNGWIKSEISEIESYTRFYNKDWVVSNKQDSVYIMKANLYYEEKDSGKLLQIDLIMEERAENNKTMNPLCNIVVKSYIPYEGGAL